MKLWMLHDSDSEHTFTQWNDQNEETEKKKKKNRKKKQQHSDMYVQVKRWRIHWLKSLKVLRLHSAKL